MEDGAGRVERRGRKRRRKDVQNVAAAVDGQQTRKKQAVETRTRSTALVGRYVQKEFEGSGVFLGKIAYYDTGLYRIDYEDGDCEDLEGGELREFLIEDGEFKGDLVVRKMKLDGLVSKKYVKTGKIVPEGNAVKLVNAVDKVGASLSSELSNGGASNNDGDEVDAEADSSSDSCDDVDLSSEAEAPTVPPPPQLPPSSGNIAVQEEYVSHLFSVYGFLRSFSIPLFLSPFGLDDFVGSLNCPVPNALLDAIHVALMRALRRHLEGLSSDGSELASKCLRCMDWNLLDTLTWPVYLVQYLITLGYTEGPHWKGFYVDALERDYYTLSAGSKLMVLQILCDDVLDSAELRAEMDLREELEVGIGIDGVTIVPPESGPRRVHPRYSKTSACKDQEAMEIIAESHGTKSSFNSSSLDLKSNGPNADQDGNGDECRLCGMDGTLLCCDGCPSAYHSRCIGAGKILGETWYCPECVINKTGPTITRGTSLRGAENFGVDLYEQLFLGTCNYLLVLKVSMNSEPCLRYYNQNDIPKVLKALHSSVQHISMYSAICKEILEYWKVPEDVLSLTDTVEMYGPRTLLGKESHSFPEMVEFENFASGVTESSLEKVVVSCHENIPFWDIKHSEQIRMGSSMSAGSVVLQADPSNLNQKRLAEKSSLESATCTSGSSSASYRGHGNGMFVQNMSTQSKEANGRVGGRIYGNVAGDCLYVGSSFKPQAYINYYTHGDFAATAATNLAVLSSEENRPSESHALDNYRKALNANILFQVKAFSSAAIRFVWPNTEKKLVEVPRERCGWCLSCKAPSTSKRGCLLNAAASNAIKGPMKILSVLRPARNADGNLPGIATYLMFIEESLRGLTVGPFSNLSYREQWRKQVEQATTCSSIKTLLLDLEENIRGIALSGDWAKPADNWSGESSVIQSATSASGSTQRRGPGRRSRKQIVASDVAADDGQGISTGFIWWRGGILSMLIFQKGTLPRSLAKKAARQGGSRKVPGIFYAEGFDVPKRTKQFIWRAAVEMSKNASQLALQVRYLDLHLRWSDLVGPEPSIQDGKGSETEASAFRNAIIWDKRIVENKIRYGVDFENQKHLPSRVLKNILEVEQSKDGKDKYWFLETRIPLYLIKAYEEKVEKVFLPSADKTANGLSKLQKRQLKASRKDIFSYLMRKRDNLDKCCCASCQQDVLLRNAVQCSECQGYCHEHCTTSAVHKNEQVYILTCNQCNYAKAVTQSDNNKESPTSPLLLQGEEFQTPVTVTKGGRQNGYKRPSASGALENSYEMISRTQDSTLAAKSKQRNCSWGLIWKKKNCEDTCIDFRLNNIVLKGNPNINASSLECHLCHESYNPDLMYIRCEACQKWYHAEAVELEESKIFDLAGFKCCRCRRIRSPLCPYMNQSAKLKLLGSKKMHLGGSKKGNVEANHDPGTISEQQIEEEPATPVFPTMEEVLHIQENDPLPFPICRVERYSEQNPEVDLEWNTASVSGHGPQKLPIRRHMKCEKDLDGLSANNLPPFELSNPPAGNVVNPEEKSSPLVEWGAPINGFEDDMMFDYEDLNYEDMEFEPQTYFSFKELLAPDDAGQLDISGDVAGNWENSSLSRDGDPEHYENGITYDHDEPTILVEAATDLVPCQICSHTEPSPDRSCQNCGLWIHRHCSPWVESSEQGGWRCGNCREW
ncbi:hypothetical protein RJ640_025028, partial [Escallonia rubra]